MLNSSWVTLGFGCSAVAMAVLAIQQWYESKQLQSKLEHVEQLREEERMGRIHGEQQKRNEIVQNFLTNGFHFHHVATFKSCFVERRGTPRQGGIVPSALGCIRLCGDIADSILDGLTEFSHLWVIFVFHKNTNLHLQNPSSTQQNSSAADDHHQRFPNLPTKIAPPRLDGHKKVGVFATRSPHRPAPIGLSLVKLKSIQKVKNGKFVDIVVEGADLVDGTPILDVKPYIAHFDALSEATSAPWVHQSADRADLSVEWSSEALANVDFLTKRSKQNNYYPYSSLEGLCQTVTEALRLDIRAPKDRSINMFEGFIRVCSFHFAYVINNDEQRVTVTSCSKINIEEEPVFVD